MIDDYKVYKMYRSKGTTSLEAYRRLKSDRPFDMFSDIVKFVAVAIPLFSIGVLKKLPREYRGHYLRNSAKAWILPPKGAALELPLYTALRLVRKRGWFLAVTEPERTISKREAFRILVFGDKRQTKRIRK